MPVERAKLAQLVLKMIKEGQRVPTADALQLRNWADTPQEAMLSLEEIASHILDREPPNTE
jgi:hypothetical protein